MINSPGGNINDAMAMGRLLRSKGALAVVARTVPKNCTPSDQRDCRPAASADASIEAELRNDSASCSSACVLLLLGAAAREVPPSARVGIHAMKMFMIDRQTGKRVDPASVSKLKDRGEQLTKDMFAARDRYFREMKIGLELARASDAVGFDTLKFLSRSELFDFGIDKREFGNTIWVSEPSRVGGVISTKLFRKGWGGASDFSNLLLRISCFPGRPVELTYTARGEANAWPNGNVVVRFGESAFRLPPRRDSGTAEDRTILVGRSELPGI
jgi:hypothetical protein